MATYDDTELTITFTYKEWCLVHDCMAKRRSELHDRADTLQLGDPDKLDEQRVALRRKAAAIYELMQEVVHGLADTRQDFAVAKQAAS